METIVLYSLLIFIALLLIGAIWALYKVTNTLSSSGIATGTVAISSKDYEVFKQNEVKLQEDLKAVNRQQEILKRETAELNKKKEKVSKLINNPEFLELANAMRQEEAEAKKE